MDSLISPNPVRASAQKAVERLSALLGPEFAAVDREIAARMDSPVALIPEIGRYIVAAGGKRLRPLLVLAAHRLSGGTGDEGVRLAAAVEFIHTATLLHDDVVDMSTLRRGRPSANVLFGNQPSVLVGDFLFARAFELMVGTQSLRVLGILSRASAVIAEGEVMQLAAQRNVEVGEARYLEIIEAKTAALFAAATQAGGVAAGCSPAKEAALESYGRNLGVAFQLVDDALDYSGAAAAMGKNAGDDFAEGKVTLPVLIAMARGTDADRAFFRRTIADNAREEGDLARAVAIVERCNGVAETVARAQRYADAAARAVSAFPGSALRDALVDVAGFCVERAY